MKDLTLMYILIIIALLINAFLFYKKVHLNTGFMSIVMTLGILNFGVLHLSENHSLINAGLYYLSLFLWFIFWINIFVIIVQRAFVDRHIIFTTNRFTIGTWVAGNSVTVVLMHFTSDSVLTVVIAILNIGLWIGYIGLSVHTLIIGLKLWKSSFLYGNLFLMTVSTQSIAIMSQVIFPNFNKTVIFFIIGIGLLLYLISFLYVVTHFSFQNWSATNCIFHGALSISGVALTLNGLIQMKYAILLWMIAIVVFIVIEAMEVHVFIQRLKENKMINVIFAYHLSHWSRLFTFGMLYTFTSLINFHAELLKTVKHFFLSSLFIVIFLLLCIETLELVVSFYRTVKKEHSLGDARL